jgi:hypothetical protein
MPNPSTLKFHKRGPEERIDGIVISDSSPQSEVKEDSS